MLHIGLVIIKNLAMNTVQKYTHRSLHGFKDPQFDGDGFVHSSGDCGDHPFQQFPLVLQERSKVSSFGNHLAAKVIFTKLFSMTMF